MDTDERRLEVNAITELVIGSAYQVSNTLGCGFLERVYENALAHELRSKGLRIEQQVSLKVYYDAVVVGDYVADMLVEGQLLLELKAVKSLDDVHVAQCINYLNGTGLKLCLLLNFGRPRLELRRIIR